METARVNIVYRPLRIAFAVHSSDLDGFRKAVRTNYALWGGRFNPILLADRPEAKAMVEVFRPDFIVPIGEATEEVDELVAAFPHLSNPLFHDELFLPKSAHSRPTAQILDVQNLMFHWRDRPDWKAMVDAGVRVAKWSEDDPLADPLLIMFGGYPDPGTDGIDYDDALFQATQAIHVDLSASAPIPVEVIEHASIAHLSRWGLEPHYSSDPGWDYPGFYFGDAGNIDDLANFWNLRAAGVAVQFFDPTYQNRFDLIRGPMEARLRAGLAGRRPHEENPAIWSRPEKREIALQAFDGSFVSCTVDTHSWNGLNIRPTVMHFSEEASLGVLGASDHSPRISFALREKPFSDDPWFYSQHLIASVSLIGGRGDGGDYVFVPPYVPELNEFVGRAMYHDHRGVRIESERLGVVIDTAEHDIGLQALPVPALIGKLFELAGFDAKPSGSGLITRQLIARMGGLSGARAFKIPGVRRLLKTYGPTTSFTKKGAIQLIAQTDPVSGAKFEDHHDLYIEPRSHDSKLTPQDVFSHLVAKGLFRIGVDLKCPVCSLTNWIPLDVLKQQVTCDLCGAAFDGTRQLVDGQYAYRRSGVLGLEKNNQGAVPVALLLQQLSVNSMGLRHDGLFSASLDLAPRNVASALPVCETDFVVVFREPRTDKVSIVVGESKDAGGSIDANDIANLRSVADAFPKDRFKAYILLSKLSAFSAEEIELARGLNEGWERRVILLTHRELEPYHLFERTNKELNLTLRASSAEELAKATHEIYFQGLVPVATVAAAEASG